MTSCLKVLLCVTIVTACFCPLSSFGQQSDEWIEIDTLNQKNDSLYVKLYYYDSGTLTKEKNGYLHLDSGRFIRYPRFPYIFKKKLYYTAILKHGPTIEYLNDGRKKVTEYAFDRPLSTRYFDSANNDVTPPPTNRLNFECGITIDELPPSQVRPRRK